MRNSRALGVLFVSLLVVLAGCTGATAAVTGVDRGVEQAGPPLAEPPSSTPGEESAASANATASNGTTNATTANATTAKESANATANGTLELHFINVGQSSSLLLVAPNNETLLVDTGDWRDDGSHVLRYLEAQNVTRIDHLVTSHADADHIGGHAAVIEHYETEADGVGAVYDPGIPASSQTYARYLDAVERHNVTLYRAAANDTIPFAGVETAVLAPPERPLADGQRNENSIVLAVEHGGHEFLLPGDAETEAESYLVDTYNSTLDATVLSAGHHGSRTSSGTEFLNATTPRIAVVSSAYDSQYGHPHNETLRRLANRSIPTYWTATHGDILLESDGRNLTVSTQRAAPTNATELRSAPAVEPGTVGNATPRETVVAANDSEANDTLANGSVLNGTAANGTIANRTTSDGSTVRTPTVVRPPTATPTATAASAPTATPTDAPTRTSTATPTPTATPDPTPTATDAPPATGSLSLVRVHADASGGSEWDNLDDEYLVFENTGEAELDLSGWAVRDEADHVYRFPNGFTLEPGASVTLRTGTGSDDATDLYWGSDAPVWNNGGDTVVVTDGDGTVVVEETYP